MKAGLALVFLAAVALLAHVDAFPGARRDSAESSETDERNDGLFLVLPRRNIMDDTSLFGSSSSSSSDEDDDEIPSIWHPFKFQFNSSPFENFLSRMQATMNKIRAEMAATLAAQLESSHLPQLPHESSSGVGSSLGPLSGWGRLPEGANTTSTTKIVGNHTVTINETTYTDGDENSGMVYRIRVVDVKPLESAAAPAAPAATDSDEAEEQRPAVVPSSFDEDNNNEKEKNEDSEDDLDEQQQQSKKDRESTTATQQQFDVRDREELTTQSHRSAEAIDEFDNEIPKNQFETVAL